MASSSRIQYITQVAKQLDLDPRAVLAIGGHEGLSGGIGDGGHAFGPWQMNNAGGVLTGQFKGETPQQINQWAWSNAGIKYALSHMAKVAGGLTGKAAIDAITTRYERPANPAAEIADAWSHYGGAPSGGNGPTGGGGGGMSLPGGVTAGGTASRQQLAALAFGTPINFNSNQVQTPNLTALIQAQQQGVSPHASTPGNPVPHVIPHGTPTVPTGSLGFMGDTQGVNAGFLSKVSSAARAAGATKVRVTSGYRSPEHNAAVGGVQHSNHMSGHALDGEAFIPGKGWLPLGQVLLPVAGKYGLRSGDTPGFFNGGTDPVHVDDGWNQSH